MSGVPEGYRKLPTGVRCRCVKLWQQGGDYYCCNPGAIRKADDLKAEAQGSERGRTGSETLPTGATTFAKMLNSVIAMNGPGTLRAAATGIGISPQYLHDLREGRRLPSVAVTDKICDWLGRGPKGRAEWHRAGALAHGWKISRLTAPERKGKDDE